MKKRESNEKKKTKTEYRNKIYTGNKVSIENNILKRGRSTMITGFKGKGPKISKTAFVAASADIVGDIELGDNSSIWFNAVLRADKNKIKIGNRTSIQDNVVIHVDPENGVQVGDNVSVGHGAVLHGCKIGDNVLIGMNSTILNGTEIGKNSIVGANALVTEGKKFPENSLITGVPGNIKRQIQESEIASITKNAQEYVELAEEYKKRAEVQWPTYGSAKLNNDLR